jgi:hypothetical protein
MYTGKVNGSAKVTSHRDIEVSRGTVISKVHVPVIEGGQEKIDKYGRNVWRQTHRETVRMDQVRQYFVEVQGGQASFMTKKTMMYTFGKKSTRRLIREYKQEA